jgi:hypothetical protein
LKAQSAAHALSVDLGDQIGIAARLREAGVRFQPGPSPAARPAATRCRPNWPTWAACASANPTRPQTLALRRRNLEPAE